MQKFIPAVLALMLAGCGFPGVYKIDIQQGNIITQDMLDQLKPGLSRNQVHYVLGNPVIDNSLDPSLESYVYTLQLAGGAIKQQLIKIHYNGDTLVSFDGTLLPPSETGLTPRSREARPLFDETPSVPQS